MISSTTMFIVGLAALGYFWWQGDSKKKEAIKETIEKKIKDVRPAKDNLLEAKKLLESFGADEIAEIMGHLATGELEAADTDAEHLNKSLKSDEFKAILLKRVAKRVIQYLVENPEHKSFIFEFVDKLRKSHG